MIWVYGYLKHRRLFKKILNHPCDRIDILVRPRSMFILKNRFDLEHSFENRAVVYYQIMATYPLLRKKTSHRLMHVATRCDHP